MWTDIEGQNVKIAAEVVPNSVWRYMSRNTLAAVRRFYSKPENRAAFEAWKNERETKKTRNSALQDQ